MRVFGVSESGNFEGRNILRLPRSPEAIAQSEGLALPELWRRIDGITGTLEPVRAARPKPHRDEKILTAWNGMMIAALAEVGDTLGEPRYVQAALRAAELLWSKVRGAPGTLNRVLLDGRASLPALQEDYAFLGEGLVALFDATGEPQWLERARELADAMWTRFADPQAGGLFMAEPSEIPQMARPKDIGDAAMPSGTSAALTLLASLSRRTDEAAYGERAKALVAAASSQVARAPQSYPSLLVALDRLRHGETGPRQYAAQGAIRIHALAIGRPTPDQPVPSGGRLIVEIAMAPGWHINAHRPLQDYLIPTTLTGAEGRGWRVREPKLPRARGAQARLPARAPGPLPGKFPHRDDLRVRERSRTHRGEPADCRQSPPSGVQRPALPSSREPRPGGAECLAVAEDSALTSVCPRALAEAGGSLGQRSASGRER